MENKNNPFDYSGYASVGHNQPTDLLEVARLAELQHTAQVRVENLEAELQTAKNELRELAEKQLPEEMERLGLSTYTTSSGIGVEVKEKVRGSLPAENRPKGYTWLEDNGFAGMIKSKVVVDFRRDQLDDANKLVQRLREEERIANLERKIEAATLDAFIREQLAQGRDIPLDIFGVFRQRVANVEVKY